MTTSHYQTETFTSENFVESAGTILFRLSTKDICIMHDIKRNEYILPKGRRNVGESRRDTAIRETTEETGIPCRLLPINIKSRLCPSDEKDVPDDARIFKGVCEPISVQMRRIGQGEMKVIWWYVAAVDENKTVENCEDEFEVEWYGYEEALEKLTFQNDRELVARAIELIQSHYS
ncbi:NUDIX domain [Fusarium acutatum]|uniref:NUDIX domain n=1 Tax=Fusarium acutatum TaxID=78861 RepID=A0A8H4K0R0_9HYPO|nr:NUDIX domain [Fusarium acutatum]